MVFKDLKAGYPVYLLHKADDTVSITQGKVTAVSLPRLPQPQQMGNMQMVVDVTIEADGVTRTYVTTEQSSVVYAGLDTVLSTEKDGIVKELEALKSSDEAELAKATARQSRVERCEELLSEFNPVFKERKQAEDRFNKIENSIVDLKTMLTGLVKELKG